MNHRHFLNAAIAAALLSGCAIRGDVAAERNQEIVRQYFEGWANRADPAVADELIAPDMTLSNPPSTVRGLAAYKEGMNEFHAAFPDLQFTIDDVIADESKAAALWTLRATQRGAYHGKPATGRSVTVTGISAFRIADGQITEITVAMDRLGLLQQLGWLPEGSQ